MENISKYKKDKKQYEDIISGDLKFNVDEETKKQLSELEKEFTFEDFQKSLQEDLLVLDKKIPKEDYQKIERLIEEKHHLSAAKNRRLVKKAKKYPHQITQMEDNFLATYLVLFVEIKKTLLAAKEVEVKINESTNK